MDAKRGLFEGASELVGVKRRQMLAHLSGMGGWRKGGRDEEARDDTNTARFMRSGMTMFVPCLPLYLPKHRHVT